jgi:hypothetical protein
VADFVAPANAKLGVVDARVHAELVARLKRELRFEPGL